LGKYNKLLGMILSGQSDASISFSNLRHLLIALNFDERIKGDHYIFTKDGIDEIINLQPHKSKAKPYQVKQVRNIIVKYKLGFNHVE